MSKSDPDFWRDGDPTGEGAPDSEVSDDYAAKYLRKPRKRAAIIITDAPAVVLTETWLDYTQRLRAALSGLLDSLSLREKRDNQPAVVVARAALGEQA